MGTQLDHFYNSKEVAEHLGVTTNTLAVWRHEGTGPRFYRLGGTIRYRATDLEEWLENNVVETN